MPRRAIASGNRVGSGSAQFPKLKFQTKGERKRILLIDPDGPWQEYIHYIKEPILIDNVKPKMETKERPRSGDEYLDYATTLLSMALCLGDAAVIEDRGYDEKNCPACAAVKEAPGEARLAPVLRFAANVVDYVLKPGSWNVQKPFSASVKIWNFTSNVYDDIIGMQEQNGDIIRAKDLTLECTNATFGNAKMGVMQVPGWQELDAASQLGQLLAEEGNVATDEQLKDSCGRSVKRAFMEEDVQLALRKWRRAIAYNEGGSETAGVALGGGQQPQNLQAGVSALLNDPSVQQADAELAAHRERLLAAAQAHAEAAGPEAQGALPTASGLAEFTPEGNSQAAQDRPAPAVSDPFAALGGSAPAATLSAPSAASNQAAPAAPASTLSAPSAASNQAAPAAPASTPTAPPPSEQSAEGKSAFDTLVQGLGG